MKPLNSTSTESDHQKAIIKWSRTHPICSQYLMATMQSGKYGIAAYVARKALGQRAGVSDLFLAYPIYEDIEIECDNVVETVSGGKRILYAGLWMELKCPEKTAPSFIQPNQREWLERMTQVGYCARVVYGFNGAITTIEEYLK